MRWNLINRTKSDKSHLTEVVTLYSKVALCDHNFENWTNWSLYPDGQLIKLVTLCTPEGKKIKYLFSIFVRIFFNNALYICLNF